MVETNSSNIKLVDISFAYLDRQFDEKDITLFQKLSSGDFELVKDSTEHFISAYTLENCFKIIEYLCSKDYVTIVSAFEERINIKLCKGINIVG